MADSELDQWLAKRRAAQAGQAAPSQPSPATGGSDLDQWLAKRRQGKLSSPERRITPESQFGPLAESLQDQERRAAEQRQAEQARKQAEFEAKPLTTQWSERGYDALARAGG